jgi:aminopeptidase N
MPAYLVAFVVSDYSYVEADPSILKDRPVRVRLIATPSVLMRNFQK